MLLGPGDLSMSISVPGAVEHPQMREATRRVATAARSAGKVLRMRALWVGHARRWHEKGADLLVTGTDVVLIKNGHMAFRLLSRPGFEFQNHLPPAQRRFSDETHRV